MLRTNRGLLKYILLSAITLGIYGLVCMTNVGTDLNQIASRYDGKKSTNFCLMVFLISPITLGIGMIVWIHNLCARMGKELQRRGISYSFGAGTFWGWGVLGSLIVVGPFIWMHKLFKSINLLAENYNQYGA